MRPQEIADQVAEYAARTHGNLCSILTGPRPVIFSEARLMSIRDALHSYLSEWEVNGQARDFDELYLPMFDALAELTWALRTKPFDRKRLEIARDLFFEVHGTATSPLLFT